MCAYTIYIEIRKRDTFYISVSNAKSIILCELTIFPNSVCKIIIVEKQSIILAIKFFSI